MASVTEIIRAWPTAGDLANDLQMAGRKGTKLVNMWAYRGKIPPGRFPEVVAAAQKRGLKHIDLHCLFAANYPVMGATE